MNAIEHDRTLELWSGPAFESRPGRTEWARRAPYELDPPIASLEVMAARTEIERFRAGEIAEIHLQNSLRRLAIETFVTTPLRRLIARIRRQA